MGMASGNDDPFRCQCGRWTVACTSHATQEDARCDICRGGGCAVIAFGSPGAQADEMDWENAQHVRMDPLVFEFGGPAVTAGDLPSLGGRQVEVTVPLNPAGLAALQDRTRTP